VLITAIGPAVNSRYTPYIKTEIIVDVREPIMNALGRERAQIVEHPEQTATHCFEGGSGQSRIEEDDYHYDFAIPITYTSALATNTGLLSLHGATKVVGNHIYQEN
jgi:hypothetical protein